MRNIICLRCQEISERMVSSMGRLMKAEWYRLKHSSELMKWLFFVGIIGVVFVHFQISDVGNGSLAQDLSESVESYIFIICCLSILSAVMIGTSYTSKIAYYEVMAGNKIWAILLSKVFVSAGFVTVISSLVLDIYWLVIGMRNGAGYVIQLPLRFILLAVIFFHVCSMGVLITTTFQHIAASVLSYLRFIMFDSLVLFCIMLFGNFSGEISTRIRDWFIIGQLSAILNCEVRVTGHLIFATVFGMLIEAAVWYVLSCVRMKRKLYQ